MTTLVIQLKNILRSKYSVECDDVQIWPKIMGNFIEYDDVENLLKNEDGEFEIKLSQIQWGNGYVMDYIDMFFCNIQSSKGIASRYMFCSEGDRYDPDITPDSIIDQRELKRQADDLVRRIERAWADIFTFHIFTTEDEERD